MERNIEHDILRLIEEASPPCPNCQQGEAQPNEIDALGGRNDFALLLGYLENSHRLALAAYQEQFARRIP